MAMSADIKMIVVTPERGDENFRQRLSSLGCVPCMVENVQQAAIIIQAQGPYGLLIPNLEGLTFNDKGNEMAVYGLLALCTIHSVSRVVVIADRPELYEDWKRLSNENTLIGVVSPNINLLYNVARFVAGMNQHVR